MILAKDHASQLLREAREARLAAGAASTSSATTGAVAQATKPARARTAFGRFIVRLVTAFSA